MDAVNRYLHDLQPGSVVQQALHARVEVQVVVRLDVEHEVGVGHAHVALEGQVVGPAGHHGGISLLATPLTGASGVSAAHISGPGDVSALHGSIVAMGARESGNAHAGQLHACQQGVWEQTASFSAPVTSPFV